MANLKRGSTGSEVLEVQKALGFTGKDLDGIYGPKTEAAVIEAQKNKGAKLVDGIVGPETRSLLFDTGTTNSNTAGAGTQKTNTGGGGAGNTGNGGATGKETFTTPAGNTYESFTYDEFTYDPFQGSDTLNQAWDTLGQLQGNAPGAWTDPYKDKYMGYLNQYENRDPFSYDFNSDALYQQYKDQYAQQGQMAMMDTMGQAAAMTGGYGNSYAQTVGQQVYNQYLGQLNEIMPELYDRAYGIYQQEGQELLDMYNAYLGLSQNDYNQYLGDVDRYYKELGAASDYATTLYDKEYGEWSDKTKMDFDTWDANTGLSFDEWAAKTGILSDENNTLMNQKFQADENQKDRNANAKANAKSDLINLITSTGYNPSDSELKAAGMTREQANGYAKAYTDSKTKTNTSTWENGDLTDSQVKMLQEYLGVTVDGKWGDESFKAAGNMTADEALKAYKRGELKKGAKPGEIEPATMSDAAKKFMSNLPYAHAGSSAETWKGVVKERMMAQYDSGVLTDEDVMAIINQLGL